MEKQNQIKQTLSRQDPIGAIRQLLNAGAHQTRSSLAEAARAGHFVLSAVRVSGRGIGKSPRRLGAPVAVPVDVPDQAGEVHGLTLTKAEDLAQMRVWNELMLGEHPQGAGPLGGRRCVT
jgi:hypothetical protein